LFRDPFLLLLAGTIFFYVGAEIGISNWIAEYFVEIHHSSAAVGALMVSRFCGLVFFWEELELELDTGVINWPRLLALCSIASPFCFSGSPFGVAVCGELDCPSF
jgi:fucose permease